MARDNERSKRDRGISRIPSGNSRALYLFKIEFAFLYSFLILLTYVSAVDSCMYEAKSLSMSTLCDLHSEKRLCET